ncbi:MAG TPA: AlkA N-terminal domain-containing protein [Steroidobacteraceae bacterium]|nr:AlkA N-terminal domain-containing protein [Steroidobacteraceae bacterium]
MNISGDICFRAVRARDRRFDGRFFSAVATTGIYCRPICPARGARRENLRFFPSAAAAERAGFRPCLRCRPERAPGIAPVDAVSRLVAAAVAGIEEHALSGARVDDLAASLGVSDRHLRRVMAAELGVSPIELAQTQRLLLAKRLLDETPLQQTQIAFASGFASVRRFNALFKARYGLCPRTLRGRAAEREILCCRLEFRPPLAWGNLLAYLGARAIAGVEAVDATHYRRTVAIGPYRGWVAVSLGAQRNALCIELSRSLSPVIAAVLARLKDLFDLGAVPDAVGAHLSRDPALAPLVRRLPGLRVPGAFDGFETAARIVLGQQVSVRAASTLAARLAQACGEPIATPYASLRLLTPTAARIAAASTARLTALGIVEARARALILLAQQIALGKIRAAFVVDVDRAVADLQSLRGFGPWTAQMIAMRVWRSPDAFPSGDLALRRAAGARPLHTRAAAWRPWRAYAAHYLWQSQGVS